MSAAIYNCLLGLECQDFTIIASDQTAAKSIIILKNNEDKLLPLSSHLIMGVNGDPGDILQFAQYVSNNLALYEIKNGYQLDIEASVHFTRNSLYDAFLRFQPPYEINILMGGWDAQRGGQLFAMDATAACVRVPFAAHGYAGHLAIGILQQYQTRDMSERQAYEVLQMCVREIHERFFINLPNFQVKIIAEEGIRTLPVISLPI